MIWFFALLLWVTPAQAQCLGFQCPSRTLGAVSGGAGQPVLLTATGGNLLTATGGNLLKP